jgi:hypothetical protein
MNEQDFRVALHQSMATQQAPPPMSDAPVLEAAHRDRKRRRALFAGIGSAGAVAAIVVGVAVIAPSGGSHSSIGVGGVQTSESGDQATDTDPQFPDGMTDRTARQGPHYDRGVALAAELAGAIPAGYDSPADLTGSGPYKDQSLQYNQAQWADTIDGVEVWEYQAIAPVTKGNGVGRLMVEVHTPRNRETGDGCAMTPAFWGVTGTCTEVQVNGKPVGVVTADSDQLDQWAGYRHEDGTVVFVAQSVDYPNAELPALDGLPLTAEQLAELAANPRFNQD